MVLKKRWDGMWTKWRALWKDDKEREYVVFSILFFVTIVLAANFIYSVTSGFSCGSQVAGTLPADNTQAQRAEWLRNEIKNFYDINECYRRFNFGFDVWTKSVAIGAGIITR